MNDTTVRYWKKFIKSYLIGKAKYHTLYEDDNGLAFCFTFKQKRYVGYAFLSGKSKSTAAIEMEMVFRLRCLMTLLESVFETLQTREAMGYCVVGPDRHIAVSESEDDGDDEWPITSWECIQQAPRVGSSLHEADRSFPVC